LQWFVLTRTNDKDADQFANLLRRIGPVELSATGLANVRPKGFASPVSSPARSHRCRLLTCLPGVAIAVMAGFAHCESYWLFEQAIKHKTRFVHDEEICDIFEDRLVYECFTRTNNPGKYVSLLGAARL
jgi:hypothetical protein